MLGSALQAFTVPEPEFPRIRSAAPAGLRRKAWVRAMLRLLSNQLHQGSRSEHETWLRGVKPQFRALIGQMRPLN